MDGTVSLPIAGPVKKKTAIASAIGIGVLGVIWYVRQRRASTAASTASTAAAGQQTDPAGNTGTIDPQTGYVAGSAEDQQALAALQSAVAPYDTSGLGGGLSGYYYGSGGSTSTTPPGPGNFADNAEWAQYAEQYMISTLQANAETVGNALGKYITGQPVTTAQRDIIDQAIAIAGTPPTAGPGGDPPGINLQGTNTGTGGGTKAPKTAPGGWSVTPGKGSADLGWSEVTGATGYQVVLSGPTHYDRTISETHLEHLGLKPGHYSGHVRAHNSAGFGPWSASKTFTVK